MRALYRHRPGCSGEHPHISRPLSWQRACPAQIIALNKAKIGWFINDVLVLNAGRTGIRKIQLGICIGRAGADRSVPQPLKTMLGSRIPVAIAPGETAALGPQVWTVGAIRKDLRDPGGGDFMFSVGVANVTLADGSVLSYDPDTYFREERLPDIDALYRRLDPEIVRIFAKAAAARAAKMAEGSREMNAPGRGVMTPSAENASDGYFTCDRTPDPVYCTNNYTSCTETACPTPDNCPHRQCRYVE